MKNNTVVVGVVVALVVGAAAFFGGMKYQQSKSLSFAGFQQGGAGGNFQGRRQGFGQGNRAFGGMNVGQVIEMDSSSITLKLQDGSSKIINLSSATTYTKSQSATESDVKKGDTIAAIGQTNSDGSITAQNIQINPVFRQRISGMPQPSLSPTK